MGQDKEINIHKEVDKIMRQKAEKILNQKKKENKLLELVVENKIDDYSVDKIKDLLE